MKKLAFILFIALSLVVALLISCGENDEDAGSGDDDNDTDQTDDDNGSDDDTASDDDISPADPFRLLINGTDGAGLKSWEQTDDGWREWEVPLSDGTEPDATRRFGPFLVVDGRYGYAAVNYSADGLKRGFFLQASLGHTWLDFDAKTGWRINDERPSAGEYANIMHLQTTGDGSLWTGAQFILNWADNGVGPGPHYYYYSRDDVFRYGAQHARKRLSLTDQSILALAVPAPDFGLVWAENIDGTGTLWSFDGQDWTVAAKPPVMAAGEIDWFWFTDSHHGYAVLSKGFWDNYLLETDGENWAAIPAPAGCDAVAPCRIFATGDNAIVIDTTRRTSGFWERRGGEWNCRTADLLPEGGFWEQALVTADGSAYAVINEGDYEPCLLEIDADTITRIELPPDLIGLQSVHALGDGAPPVSYSPYRH